MNEIIIKQRIKLLSDIANGNYKEVTMREAGQLLNYITNLQEENQKLVKVIEDIDKYIRIFKIEDIGEKTMLILNDILLIKNGLGKDVVRLNKLTELKGGSDEIISGV